MVQNILFDKLASLKVSLSSKVFRNRSHQSIVAYLTVQFWQNQSASVVHKFASSMIQHHKSKTDQTHLDILKHHQFDRDRRKFLSEKKITD